MDRKGLIIGEVSPPVVRMSYVYSIYLSLPKILVLNLTGPVDPKSRLYVLSDGTTRVDFLIMCEFYDLVLKGFI